jgi:ferric-dicitrate binding protein FerR (iron transport regulator)
MAEQFVEVTTLQKQHRLVNLPDGSVIQLNSNTKLSYPADFNLSNRKVIIYGEAFFAIHHDSESPFLVNLNDSMSITVTGTSFNVINYHENAEIEVVLVEGALQLSIKSEKSDWVQKLNPSEKGVFNRLSPGENFRITKIDESGVSEVTAWLTNELFFNNTTFEKIAHELENEYGIQIVIDDDGLKGVTFTGKFSTEESVYKVLETISHTEPFVYEMENGKIHISRKN